MVAQQKTIAGENNLSCETTSQEYIKDKMMMMMMVVKGKRAKRTRSSSTPIALTKSTSASTTSDSQPGFGSHLGVSKEEEDMAHCLILLAQGSDQKLKTIHNNNNNGTTSYDCKTCNRSFQSFQALGGHRASHKKPKLPVTILDPKKSSSLVLTLKKDNSNPIDQLSDDNVSLTLHMANPTPSKVKVHECAICGAKFSSGQALGGHMRRHRPVGVPSNITTTVNVEKTTAITTKNLLSLDLNLPAPEEDDHIHHKDCSEFVFDTKEKTLVFTAPSLVDCHY